MSTSWYVKPASSGAERGRAGGHRRVGGGPSSDAPPLGVGHEQAPFAVGVGFLGRIVAGFWKAKLAFGIVDERFSGFSEGVLHDAIVLGEQPLQTFGMQLLPPLVFIVDGFVFSKNGEDVAIVRIECEGRLEPIVSRVRVGPFPTSNLHFAAELDAVHKPVVAHLGEQAL